MGEDSGLPSGALALRAQLQGKKTRKIGSVPFSDRCAALRLGDDSLWAIVDGAQGSGLALRCAWSPGAALELREGKGEDRENPGALELLSALGLYRVRVTAPAADDRLLRVTTTLTPSADVTVPWWPRDLYLLGPDRDPARAQGRVLAAQRGMNTGLLYGRIDTPGEGTFFYLQDFGALNDFFNASGTQPDGVVGGEWPELGYCAPAVRESPLPAGKEIVVSDAFLRLDSNSVADKRDESRLFLEHQAAIYPFLRKPEPEFRDWPSKAEATLRDLDESPLATVTDGGYRYVRPYVDAEVPDSMVQINVTNSIQDYGEWKGKLPALVEEFRAGIYRFFDPDVGAIRRYLNTVGPDKDPDEVDSWYLYHPLTGLNQLALSGDEDAKKLFLASLDYAIEAARIFDYEWPIQFKMSTFDIVTASRTPGKAVGQTDAGGIYAYVMLDAYDMTGEARYLEEAERAIRKTENLEFELVYQTNLTSWGAAACLRLWNITGDRFFLDQTSVFLASFFHNCAMWDARIGKVRETMTFLGVTCLHDGPYLAPYECYESFCAFHECLERAEKDLPNASRLLMAEFARYGLDRVWWFYPSSLEPTSIAHTPRNGENVRALAFPLEDLYVNGDPAGQVGQEVYGCGAAFAFTTFSFHRLEGERMLFCEYPVRDLEISGKKAAFRIRGPEGGACRARLLPPEGATVKIDGRKVDAESFEVSVGARVEIAWRATAS